MVPESRRRFLSVDFLRGLSVAGMVVANNPGDSLYVYRELAHARWHGWTAVDFVFPLFLFLVGVSVALAVPGGQDPPLPHPGLWGRALRRAGLLFALGLFLNAFPFFRLDSLRIPGVLQRIAVVYLAVLWLHLRLDSKKLVLVVAAVLLGYWLLWAFVPVPGLGRPSLDVDYNLEAWLDQIMMRGHLWEYETSWDPEGILSTFPAVALAVIGLLAGRWLACGDRIAAWKVFAVGLALHLGGLAWDEWFPINKMITTSSFVLFVGGVGVMLLALLHRLLDHRPRAAWMSPVLALGVNSLPVYVASEVLTRVLNVIPVSADAGESLSLHAWLYDALLAGVENRYAASAAWSLGLLLAMTLAAILLAARGVRVRL